MPTDFWFRLSTYLSLAAASICLGFAEWELLPEVTYFTVGVVALLGVSFVLDRRFELSLGRANLVGLLIGIVAFIWMISTLTNPNSGPMTLLEWPNSMPPVVAPLLLALIPAKLFRPKHVGDWWAMHGVAVTGVALASAMVDDPTFIVLLFLYAALTTWSLVLFFYRRSGGLVAPIPNTVVQQPAQILAATYDERPPRWVLARSLLWLSLASAVALPFFLLIPRPEGNAAWSLTSRKIDIGLSTDAAVDLKKVGKLQETNEIAYQFTTLHSDGTPYFALDGNQLWRGRAFTDYQRSQWRTQALYIPHVRPVLADNERVVNFKDMPGDSVLISFIPGAKERVVIHASPYYWQHDAVSVKLQTGLWNIGADGAPLSLLTNWKILPYTQVYRPDLEYVSPPIELIAPPIYNNLLTVPDKAFADYATALLDRLIAQGDLPKEAKQLNDAFTLTNPDYHEAIARAVTVHFQTSSEFTYSTEITWKDREIDPVLDFMLNTKSGNCERYASALIFVLRALGIPAQYVTGYKGWEFDEAGNTVIPRASAHAWAEVFISRPAPQGYEFQPDTPPEFRNRVWHWVSLDPTGYTYVSSKEPKSWLERSADFFSQFLLGYNREKQQAAVSQLWSLLVKYGLAFLGLMVAAVVALLFMRWWRKQKKAREAKHGPEWYQKLMSLLETQGLKTTTGETPKEFATRAMLHLQTTHERDIAKIPGTLMSKLYRTRYAGKALTGEEEQMVQQLLAKLDAALIGRTPMASSQAGA
jgi:transglutaminase-like putative cysteine protease